MGTKRREGLVAYYTELLGKQRSSGLSLHKFAKEAGLSPASLYQWRQRLQGMESDVAKPRVVAVRVMGDTGFRAGSISLSIGERFRVEVGPDFNEEALERLLHVLSRC